MRSHCALLLNRELFTSGVEAKKRIWKKGESSGNILKIKEIKQDCDDDALLISVELDGAAVCHTGNKSCFFKNSFATIPTMEG